MRLKSPLVGWALALAATGASAGVLNVPHLTGRVNDGAGVIPPAIAQRISAKLDGLEKRTGSQVVVLTVPSLGGEPIESFSLRVADAWKLGRKGIHDGALFLIVPGERKMRIEVGYGLEPKLTDLTSRRILDERVAPRFRAGDIGGGVDAGVDAIIAYVEDQQDALPPPGPAARPAFSSWPLSSQIIAVILMLVPAGIFSAVAIGLRGIIGWALCLAVAAGYYFFLSGWFGPTVGIAATVLWTVAFPVIKIRAGRGGLGGYEQIVPVVGLAMGLVAYLVIERRQLWILRLYNGPFVIIGLVAAAIVVRRLVGPRTRGDGSPSSSTSEESWSSHSSSSADSGSVGSSSDEFSGGGGRFGGGGASSGW
jgi:uncharacterized protein